ncbi:meiotic recombination [Serendipita sp. 400]|nr:meiotic recombination [Serendipita sp. 400]
MDASFDDMDENRPETRIQDRKEEDLIRIMLATDCHIGVHERDPVRGQDSINTFKEVLQLAAKYDVDMILMAGDLFHENRPSRESLYQTISLLREHTLGDKPVSIELLSDPNDGKAAGYGFPAINYEDPNLNVGIPFFSIHGNHDDPQGVGGHEGALCALDLLSVTGLVNYIGKADITDEPSAQDGVGTNIRPVLLRKGDTRLAIYGVGNVKDQRLHHQLRSNKIKMFTPQDKDDWFNILMLHQNRVKRGAMESVPEGMFDDMIDLVIWGHEHDCRIEPEPVAGKRYFISQPGSTVATSLADGESLTKHCALLEIQGKAFQITPIVLHTVRPFKMDTIYLAAAAEENDINLNDKMAINTFLKRRITEMIRDARKEFEERNADSDEPVEQMLPLIRLRVDTTGVKIRVGQLVQEYLTAQDMQLLESRGMNDAIETYVDKDDTHAIVSYVKSSEKHMRQVLPQTGDLDTNGLDELLANAREKLEHGHREEDEEDIKPEKPKGKSKARGANVEEDARSVDSMAMDEDNLDLHSEEPPKKAAPKRAPAKKATPVPKAAPKARAATSRAGTSRAKPKAKASIIDSDEEVEDFDDVIMNIEEDEDEEEEEEAPKAKRGKAKAPATKSSAPARKTPAPRGKKATQTTISFAPSRSKTSKMIELSDSD